MAEIKICKACGLPELVCSGIASFADATKAGKENGDIKELVYHMNLAGAFFQAYFDLQNKETGKTVVH